jgi:hypothetical protein
MCPLSRPKIDRAARGIAAAVAFGMLLGACSDMYWDRRETLALGADDAVATNLVEEMVDPWPRHSNNKNIAFNGERMQRAVECYRANKVTTPDDLSTSSASYQAGAPATPATKCAGQMGSGAAQPAAGSPTNGQTGNSAPQINP